LSLVIPFTKGNPTNTNHYNQLYTWRIYIYTYIHVSMYVCMYG
jgi:hypothetical protein